MIIRRRHTANYTTIGNVLFEDERLAADEVGILAYLLSRPHDWEVRRPALMRRWGMGRDAIKRVITNLVRFGWCRPEKTRLPNGTYFFIYEIRDEPGPQLSDEEVRRALSLVSSEAASAEAEEVLRPEGAPNEVAPCADPPTPYPSLADPSPDRAHVADINIQTTDLPRTESTQKLERERERAREKHAHNLIEFKRRWPSNAVDDQSRLDRAFAGLDFAEGQAAVDGIDAFLEEMRRQGKKHSIAGWRYIEEKRWTLLAMQAKAPPTGYPAGSSEAKAIKTLHDIAGRATAFWKIFRRPDGSVTYPKPLTPQLVALGNAPDKVEEWASLTRQQAAAWDGLLDQFFDHGVIRTRLREGSRAPWAWPPRKDGSLSTAPPPDQLMTDQDYRDFQS